MTTKPALLTVAFLTALFFVITVPTAHALSIDVDNQGVVRFFEGKVLGEVSGERRGGDANGAQTGSNQPVKTVMPAQRLRVELKNESETSRIELQSNTDVTNMDSRNFVRKEEMKSDNVEMMIPAAASTRQLNAQEIRLEQQRRSLSAEASGAARLAEPNPYRQKLMEERQTRQEEKLEIRNNRAETQEGLRPDWELESRNAVARLKGADFSYDPETNQVIVVTPSGNEHVLQHLPDQAIARMQEQGFFTDENVDLELSEGENLIYRTQVNKQKKLLGLFNRFVPTEVILDDSSGDIFQSEVPATTFIQQLLNQLSF